MSAWPWVLLVPPGLLLVAALLGWGLMREAGRIRRRYLQGRRAPLVLEEPSARFLGLSSGGPAPTGRGVLLLSEEELYFERFFPRACWRLPLDRVRKLEMPEEFGPAARPGWRFLVVVYQDRGGVARRACFQVVNVDRWIRELGRSVRQRIRLGRGGTAAAPGPAAGR